MSEEIKPCPSLEEQLFHIFDLVEKLPTPDLANADTGNNCAAIVLDLKQGCRRLSMRPWFNTKLHTVEDLEKALKRQKGEA